jgi:ribonucleoside-triphosphate reductase
MEDIKKLYVIKRDGRKEVFDPNKITNAIIKAMTKLNKIDDLDTAYDITNTVSDIIYINFDNEVDIHEIERTVETTLMDENPEVAREYTSFRGARDASRMRSSNLVKKIHGLLDYTDPDIIAENANKAADKLYVQRDLLAGTVAKEITKDLHLIPPRVQKYRDNNYIHWHDEDYSPLFNMYNCMLIDYRTMLEKGFIVGNALIETPKSFDVACTLVSQIIQGVACSQYGGQTINRIDEGLVPYVVKSYIKILKEKIKDYINFEKDIDDSNFDIDEVWNEMILPIYTDSIENINKYLEATDHSIGNNINISRVDKKKIIDNAMKKIEKVVYDGIQCLEYQVNTLFTTNG